MKSTGNLARSRPPRQPPPRSSLPRKASGPWQPLYTTSLVKDGLLLLWNEWGVVTCADARTGEVHWRERVPGSYYSSPVCLGDRLGNVSREGDFVVLAAAKRYGMLAVNRLGEGSHSTPAVANGRLYLRTFTHLFAVGGPRPKQ
jgi:outer membrane protein assembly factor BamB